jgi:hypothetical protein
VYFEGYFRNHDGKIHRIINMNIGNLLMIREIQWTKRFIGDWKPQSIKEFLFDIDPIK